MPRHVDPYCIFLAKIAIILALAVIIFYSERDWTAAVFTLCCIAAIFSAIFTVSLRSFFSIAGTLLVALAVSGIAVTKFIAMSMNPHIFDIYFYFSHPEIFQYLIEAFPLPLIGAISLLVGLTAVGYFLFKVEPKGAGKRLKPMSCTAALFVACYFAVPSEASSLGYYVSHTHYLSALFASLSDLSRLDEPSPLFARVKTAAPIWWGKVGCPKTAARPDIVVVLSESAVPPAQIASWKYNPALNKAFESFDGQTHKLRVETYGGGTWITTASLMSGLSMADLGWMRTYAPMFLKDKVHNALPEYLTSCGYKTVAVSPQSYQFAYEGPFLSSLGIQDYFDREKLAAPTKHETDDFYFGQASAIIRRHHETDSRPLFLFVMTMAAHSPYNFALKPDRPAAHFPFGNSSFVDEYLRRLTMAQDDFTDFVSATAASGRPTLIVEFGDHQPGVTQPSPGTKGASKFLADWRSPYYETFYRVVPLNMQVSKPLPKVPALDIAFLGVTILQAGGVPLDPMWADKAELRDKCRGALHTCDDAASVDAHLSKAVASKMIERF